MWIRRHRHKVFSTAEVMAKVYDGCRTAGIGCIECKGWAADSIIREIEPIQDRRREYEATPERVHTILLEAQSGLGCELR